jgi:hypothetical protein
MTSRARFGDFALPVRQHLAAAARQVPEGWRPNAVQVGIEADDFVTAVRPVLTAIGRYLADVAAIADACQPGGDGRIHPAPLRPPEFALPTRRCVPAACPV